MTALRERHNIQYKSKAVNINVRNVVIIKDESKKRGKGKISIISKLFQGKDDQMRSAGVKTPRDYLDRTIQMLYPLELHCNRQQTKTKQYNEKKLNVEAKEFCPKRTAGAIALAKIKDIAEHDDSDND